MLYKTYDYNEKGRDFVVGDIHGCYDLLMSQLQTINFNTECDRLFSVGDLVDRGPSNLDVIELCNEDWFIPVRGNHEQMCLEAYHSYYPGAIEGHISNGGMWFHSLPIEDQKSICDTIYTMPLMLEIDFNGYKVGLAHANIKDWDTTKYLLSSLDYNSMFDSRVALDLLWSRTRISKSDISVCKGIDHVFLGHTPVSSIVKLGNVSFIDTGAVFKDGFLTILDIRDYLNIS